MERLLRTLNYYFNVVLKVLLLLLTGTFSLGMYYISNNVFIKAIAASFILFIVLPSFFSQLRMLAIIEQGKYLE